MKPDEVLLILIFILVLFFISLPNSHGVEITDDEYDELMELYDYFSEKEHGCSYEDLDRHTLNPFYRKAIIGQYVQNYLLLKQLKENGTNVT